MAHPASGRKSTEHINFGKAVEGIRNGTYAHRILHEITRRRQALEDVLKYPDTSTSTVMNTLHEYLVMPIRNVLSEATRPFKLKFKWTSFTNPEEEPSVSKDPDVDQVAFLVAVSLWLVEHSHMVFPLYPQSDELNEDKMKDALNSLKLAAGVCECVEQRPKSDFLDLTVPVNQALGNQCLAEAQMVTINRAVHKGNKPVLISQLAHEVAKRCLAASTILQKCGKTVEKWRIFLMFKGELYFAIARCFQGAHFLEESEQSGMSVAVLSIASKHIAACIHLAKEYAKLKPKAKHPLTDCSDFIWAHKLVTLKIEKSDRENSMIYHQRIPEEAAPLDEPKCLVASTAFAFPPPDLSGLKDGFKELKSEETEDGETDKKLLQDKTVEEDDDDETRSGCACQRWLFISIFMPFILLLSLLGCIAWLLLWPINRFCPTGKTFSKIFKATGNLMKMPVTAINWAIGKRREREIEPDPAQESETRRNYGGTDDVSLNELDETNK